MNRSLLLLALLCLPGVAAHAEPYFSEPAQGARLDAAPAEVRVDFTEPVYELGSFIQVWDAQNRRVDQDDLRIQFGSQPTMTIHLGPLADGAYRIIWRTYSETDGHTVGGAIGFAVGGFLPPEAQSDEDATTVFSGLARALQYLGFALGIGALAFRHLVVTTPQGLHQRALLIGAASLSGGLVLLLIDTGVQTGLGLAFLGSDGGLALVRRAAWAAGLLGVTALWSLREPRRLTDGLLAAGWMVAAWFGAQVGHASIHAWAAFVQFVHIVVVSAWAGGLVFLWTQRAALKDEHWLRFGRLAAIGAVLWIASGLALSLAILPFSQWRAAGGSVWLWLLLAKLALAASMLGFAAVNRRRLSGADLPAWMRRLDLQTSVTAEALAGVVVLVLAGFLMSQSAPQLDLQDPVWQGGGQGAELIVGAVIDPVPTAAATHEVRLQIRNISDDAPVKDNTCGRDSCLSLSWWPAADGPESASHAVLVPDGRGGWTAKDVLLAVGGDHVFQVRVQTQWLFEEEIPWQVPVSV